MNVKILYAKKFPVQLAFRFSCIFKKAFAGLIFKIYKITLELSTKAGQQEHMHVKVSMFAKIFACVNTSVKY